MAVLDQLIGRVSPAAALRRARELRERGKATEAFPLLTLAAKAGLADAEYGLAQSYLEGSGVPPSRPEAVRWLKRAAPGGSVEAQALLSSLYLQGLAGDANVAEASSELGDQLFVGDDAPTAPDFESAAKWARQAAAAGSAQGQALLGYILSSGPESMRNLDEAHRCYEQSAAADWPQGHLGYALSLARRAKDPQSWRQVTEELQRAADAGLLSAVYLLADLIDQGLGIERDPERAVQMYRDAAERGHREAQTRWAWASHLTRPSENPTGRRKAESIHPPSECGSAG